MVILFGTIFLGKIAKFKTHCIETKFFYFFLPIFPVSSIYVTSSSFNKRQGIDIPLNTKSVIAAYARVYLLLFAIPFAIRYQDFFGLLTTSLFYLLLFLGGWIYFMFFYGRVTFKEKELRNKLLISVNNPIDPKLIEFNTALDFYKKYDELYKEKYNSNWKEDIKADFNLVNERQLIYGLSLYCYYAYELFEDGELFEKVDRNVNDRFYLI